MEGLLRPREKLLSDLGVPIEVAVSTADAYAKFLSKNARSSGAKILKERKVSVAILDEAQSYELDQVLAITAAPGLWQLWCLPETRAK